MHSFEAILSFCNLCLNLYKSLQMLVMIVLRLVFSYKTRLLQFTHILSKNSLEPFEFPLQIFMTFLLKKVRALLLVQVSRNILLSFTLIKLQVKIVLWVGAILGQSQPQFVFNFWRNLENLKFEILNIFLNCIFNCQDNIWRGSWRSFRNYSRILQIRVAFAIFANWNSLPNRIRLISRCFWLKCLLFWITKFSWSLIFCVLINTVYFFVLRIDRIETIWVFSTIQISCYLDIIGPWCEIRLRNLSIVYFVLFLFRRSLLSPLSIITFSRISSCSLWVEVV